MIRVEISKTEDRGGVKIEENGPTNVFRVAVQVKKTTLLSVKLALGGAEGRKNARILGKSP